MLLYRSCFELSIFLFFVLSKEVLFYGEERLITVCYLFLFFVGFFNLYEGVSLDFNSRAQSIKDELDVYFYSIITTLKNTKKFIKVSFSIFFNFLTLYKSIINEFSFYFLYHHNFSAFKRFLINQRATKLLTVTNLFFINVKKAIMKKHTASFLFNEFSLNYFKVAPSSVFYNRALASLNIASERLNNVSTQGEHFNKGVSKVFFDLFKA